MPYYIQHISTGKYLKHVRKALDINGNVVYNLKTSHRKMVVHKNAILYWVKRKYPINWDEWKVTPVKKRYIADTDKTKFFLEEFVVDLI